MSQLTAGQNVPEISLTNLEGKPFALSSLKGAPVLLNFLTANCTWCRSEMGNLAEVFQRVKHVDIHILGVVVGQDATVAAQFAKEQKLEIAMLCDDNGQSENAFQLQRVPTFIFLDSDGKIACIYEGASEQLAGIIEQTILAIAGDQELPEYSLVGNGCGVND